MSQLSANSARLAVELGTWRKHPSDKEVVTSLLGVFMHESTGFLASKELRYRNLGKDVEKNEVETTCLKLRFLLVSCFLFQHRWTFQHLFAGKIRENLGHAIHSVVDFFWLGNLMPAGIDG